nr:HPr kinase/phosphatase C-terminal domain-containing protein [uncultured Rhodopila sp.]
MHSHRRLHGSCVSKHEDAVLLVGPPGSGKSDLVLRLLARGFELVADDQVDLVDGVASCPAALAGLLEVRGLGVVQLPYRSGVRLALIVDLATPSDRMPMPRQHPDLGLPVVCIDPAAASAPERIALALECAIGRVRQVAGAFAA